MKTVYPPTNTVCGGYNNDTFLNFRTSKVFEVTNVLLEQTGFGKQDGTGIVSRVDPNQTATRSGSALFAQIYLSQNSRFLWMPYKSFEDDITFLIKSFFKPNTNNCLSKAAECLLIMSQFKLY